MPPGLGLRPRASPGSRQKTIDSIARLRGQVSALKQQLRHNDQVQAQQSASQSAAAQQGEEDRLAAQKQLRLCLISTFLKGDMPATELGRICWHLSQCGLTGFKDLALDPSNQFFDVNMPRKVARTLGLKSLESQFLKVELPMSTKAGARVFTDCPVADLVDILSAEFLEAPEDVVKFNTDLLASNKNWREHDVRMQCGPGEIAVSFGLFIDGAAWRGKGAGSKDSLVCVYVNLIGRRHRSVWVTLRKEFLCGLSCKCPCRGRCTIQALERHLAWQIDWAAEGVGSPLAFRDRPWGSAKRRSEVGQSRLIWEGRRVRFGLLECRNDWDQYSASWGMPKTNQKRPCWFCPCSLGQMHAPRASLPDPYTHASYMEAIAKSLITVSLGISDLHRVFNILVMDARDDGMHGRVLSRNIEVQDLALQTAILLQRWDRLEVAGSCWDVHATAGELELAGPPPFLFRFWRKHPDHNFAHVSPLMQCRGNKLEHLMIGDLHTLDLGVTARIIGTIFIRVLQKGTKFSNARTKSGMEQGVRSLSLALRKHRFVRSSLRKRKAGDSQLSRITLKMLQYSSAGSAGHLKAKGLETRSTLLFAHQLARGSSIPHEDELVAASGALLKAYQLMGARRRSIDSDRLEELLDTVTTKCKEAGVKMLPKFHLARHLGQLSRRAGNPAAFSEYLDESKNSLVVHMAQASSLGAPDFSGRLLARDVLYTKTVSQLPY